MSRKRSIVLTLQLRLIASSRIKGALSADVFSRKSVPEYNERERDGSKKLRALGKPIGVSYVFW